MLGVTDLPIVGTRTDQALIDLLGTDPYARGLATFITECQTPMSIAIQGDWGSGKTSILNFLREELNKKFETITNTIMVNTWQFSKLSEEQLFAAIFCAIKDELQNGMSEATREGFKKVGDVFLRMGARTIGVNADELSFSLFENNYKQVQNVRERFADAVKDKLKGHPHARIVVFVDDLDRLNPGKAVDLLESMKLFMDVPGCVFVLAVDYDVIVRGVREKYGNSFSLKRCGNFFDKIIQVPFHMPVERYTMDAMVREYLSLSIEKDSYLDVIATFSTEVIGKNPRAFKRMVNAFSLIKLIQCNIATGGQPSAEDLAVLFCTLCVQIQQPVLYEYISETDYAQWELTDNESFVRQLRSKLPVETTERELAEESTLYSDTLHALDKCIRSIFGNNQQRFERFKAIIELSAVTGRDDISRKSAHFGVKGKHHVLSVLAEMAFNLQPNDSEQACKNCFNAAVQKIADTEELTASTVRDKCIRRLGYTKTSQFIEAALDLIYGSGYELQEKLAANCSEDMRSEIESELNNIMKRK